jgi:CHAT domain-containing protein
MLAAGQTPQAVARLDDAANTIARRSMGAGWIGARSNYLRAVSQFQVHRVDLGDQSLAGALKYMRGGSHWLFHIAQVDAAVMAQAVTARNAVDLYQNVLRDPQPSDWAWDPLESLAALTVPHPEAMEHWFLAALERTDREAALATALEVSDRARRHRFFSTLALGGRLHALRWLLEAPPAALDKKALVQRQDLLADFPAYQALQQQVKQVSDRLAKIPLAPQDAEMARQQIALLADLGKLSVQQEAILREMAVRREPADMLFPPLRPTEELQKAIPAGTAVLAYFAAGNRLHGFLLNREKSTVWVVKRAQALLDKGGMAKLLREMGNYEANREVALKDLADTQWRQTARQVLEVLSEGSQADFTKKFRELVIVPDGVLWYLPFEALQVSAGDRLQPLIARFQLRYAPTLSLAVSDGRARRAHPKTALMMGRLYPRETEAEMELSSKEIVQAAPEAAVFGRAALPANSALFKTQIGQLIVLEDIAPSDQGPYAWSPIQIDRSKPGNTLGDWLALPWGGPDVVILPGFHTPAENALRRVPRALAGADVFLSVCGLMSSGARTLLVSRWRTGGQSAVDLTREFVQELPHTTPADAWQRAVMVVADSQVNLEAEPRIKKSAGDVPPKGHHPFLWAGYMLVDSGPVAEIGEAQLVKQPAKKEPAQGEAKMAAEGGAPVKPDAEGRKKPDGEQAKMPASAMDPAKPAEAQTPDPAASDAGAPKAAPGKGRGKAGAKRNKPS